MTNKRILFITYEYPPLGGGVATASKALIEEFSHYKNLKVDVITSSIDNTWKNEAIYPKITLHFVPIGKKPTSSLHDQTPWNMIKFTINSTRKIHELISQNDFDLAHFFGYPGAWPGLLFKSKLPYIISLRGVDVPGYNQKFGLYYHFYKPLTKLSWQHATYIVSNSQWLKDLAIKTLSDKKIDIIPNGVDTKLFRPLPDSKKHKKFTITAGGTLMNRKKNLGVLIDAFAQFHQHHPESQLVLFGSGPMSDSLKKQVNGLQITEAVKFKGRVSQEKLAQELPRCHVFCLPSSAEGMSNAALEALACGLPLVMTDVGASREVIAGNGYIVSPKVAEISDSFEKLYLSVNRLKQGQLSRKFSSKYSWQHTAKQYADIYLRIVNNNKD